MPRPDAAAACPHCAAPAAGPPVRTRRPATVLSAALGPQAVAQARAAIRRHGGSITQAGPDSLLAVFGTGAGDHVLAACAAALAMQELPAAAAIGLHTGQVVIHPARPGSPAGADASGEAVHAALRLQRAAAPGETLVSDVLVRAAGAAIRVRPAPAGTALLLQAIAPDLAVLEAAGNRALAPFVGRAQERKTLADAAAQARTGRGQALVLVGAAGIGKSRLVAEFVRHDMPGMAVHAAQCLRWRETVGFHPLKPLLRELLLLDGADTPASLAPRIAPRTALWSDIEGDAEALAAVLDQPPEGWWQQLDPRTRRQRMVEATARALLALSRDGPALLLVDDLHWSDPETRAVLTELAGWVADWPMLLLLGTRPPGPDEPDVPLPVPQLVLGPLPAEDGAALAARLLEAEANPLLSARLAQQAGGNPLAIVAQAAAQREAGHDAPVAEDVHSLLGASIGRADAAGRRVLEAMAAHGEPAPVPLLAEFAGLSEQTVALAGTALVQRGLAQAEGSAEWARLSCAHALVQETAYAGISAARRRALHARIGRVVEQHAGERVEEEAETLARHAERAGELPRLVRFARIAGRRAATRFSNRQAVRFYDDALDALGRMRGVDPGIAIDLQCEMRNPLEMFDPHRLIPSLEHAADIAVQIGDEARAGIAQSLLAHACWVAGRPVEGIGHGRRAVRVGRRTAQPELLVPALYHSGLAHYGAGRLRAATRLFRQVVRHADPAETYRLNTSPLILARSYLARALAEQGLFAESAACTDACRAAATAARSAYGMGFARLAEGALALARGAAPEAVEALAAAHASFGQDGSSVMQQAVAAFVGLARLRTGDQGGLAQLEEAVATTERMQVLVQQALRMSMLAEGQALAGLHGQALATADRALALAVSLHDGLSRAHALRTGGMLRLASADPAQAAEGLARIRLAAAAARRLGAAPLEAACLAAIAAAGRHEGGR